MYINKKNFNSGSKIYIVAPHTPFSPSQKIYKLIQEVQQIANKKNLLKNVHIRIIRKIFEQIINSV